MDRALDRTRLHWQCRRGMLELDIMLGEFLEARFDELDATEKRAFADLLNYQDDVLLEYIMGRMIPTDRTIANVVTKIRRSPAS